MWICVPVGMAQTRVGRRFTSSLWRRLPVEAGADRRADPVGDGRHLPLHLPELALEHDDQPHRGRRDDAGSPPLRLEQADLAEELAWTELREALAALDHVRRTLLNHEELVRELPLLRERVALVDRDLVGPLREPLQLSLGEAREESDPLQLLDVHGVMMSASSARHKSDSGRPTGRFLRAGVTRYSGGSPSS